jgi:hypothetical protein
LCEPLRAQRNPKPSTSTEKTKNEVRAEGTQNDRRPAPPAASCPRSSCFGDKQAAPDKIQPESAFLPSALSAESSCHPNPSAIARPVRRSFGVGGRRTTAEALAKEGPPLLREPRPPGCAQRRGHSKLLREPCGCVQRRANFSSVSAEKRITRGQRKRAT